MNPINDIDSCYLRGPRVTPYRPLCVGQDAIVVENSQFGKYIKNYFPECGGRVKIMSVSVFDESVNYDYVVRPHCCSDKIEVSHWHIRPMHLHETRLFAPIGLILPGVTVKLIDTKEVKRVMLHKNNITISDDYNKIPQDKLVVILVEKWDRPMLESLVRTS